MMLGHALRLGLVAGLLAAAASRAGDPVAAPAPTEMRVLSLPGRPTILRLQATPGTVIEDRTPGARPAIEGQGAASTGETFSDEITFVVRGRKPSRPATIDVEDALVSSVRLFPDPAGMQVVVFVRQPVSYGIARPSASGEIAVTLRPRAVPAASARPGERSKKKPKGEETDPDQVAVDAAELSYDQQENVLVARGGVTLARGGTTLRADEVRYDRTSAVATARGNVVLIDPEATVEGDAAELDLDDETGWIDGARGDMKQSPYRLTAEHLEKRGGPCYAIRDGVFTTCRCGGVEAPSWSIAAEEADVTLGGVGIAKGATFRVDDVPVLYTPYLVFPANTERQSGFLIPRIGYSNRRGFIYEQPFYWAIDKSSDATVTFDLETEARMGVIGEYRYVRSKRSAGAFTAGYFNESIGGQPESLTPVSAAGTDHSVNRWVVAGRHRTRFGSGGLFYLDVLRVSDDEFFRDIRTFASNVSSDVQIRSTRLTRSELGGVQTWQGGMAQLEATSYQDLVDPQRFALSRLPRLAAEHSVVLPGGFAVARLPGETVNFYRETGSDGLRLDVAPEVYVPFRLNRWLTGSVRGQLRETAYHLSDTEQVALVVAESALASGARPAPVFRVNDRLSDLDQTDTRELAQVNARLGTEFARVFKFPYFGLDRIRHAIEPELQYLFVPHVNRHLSELKLPSCYEDNPDTPNPNDVRLVPGARQGVNCGATLFTGGYLFDEVDAINRRNFFSWGVTTRILGRTGSPGIAETVADEAPDPTPASELAGDEDDDVEDIDADTIPQGLSTDAIPDFAPVPASDEVPRKTGGAKRRLIRTTASRELVRASILQGYDPSREIGGRSHLSDVDASFRVTPVSWLGFKYDTSVDIEGGETLAQSMGVVLREPWYRPLAGRPAFQAPSTLGVAYRFIAGGINEGLVGKAEQRFFRNESVESIDGSVYLRLGQYLGAGFLARYQLSATQSADEQGNLRTLGPRFLERDYFVRVMSQCDCWLVEVGVAERADTGETTARVQLVLYGLGAFGDSPSRTGYAGLAGLQGLGARRPWAVGRD